MTLKVKNPFHAHDIHAKKITTLHKDMAVFLLEQNYSKFNSTLSPLGRSNNLSNIRPRLVVVCEHSIL